MLLRVKKRVVAGFSLLELTTVIATIAILATVALSTVDTLRTERGLMVGAELRTIHLAQKQFLIQSLENPGTIDLSTLSLTDLQNRGLAPASLPALQRAGMSGLRVNSMPPTHSLDGQQGDEAKTSPSTGDHLYDIGPE